MDVGFPSDRQGTASMQRRQFVLSLVGGLASATLLNVGCRGRQVAHVLKEDDQDMVGSHAAGAETWKPLVETAMAQLLARQVDDIRMTSAEDPRFRRLRQEADLLRRDREQELRGGRRLQASRSTTTSTRSSASRTHSRTVHRRYIEAGLEGCGLRVDDLFKPANQRAFRESMERINHPFDYLMYAKITSARRRTTRAARRTTSSSWRSSISTPATSTRRAPRSARGITRRASASSRTTGRAEFPGGRVTSSFCTLHFSILILHCGTSRRSGNAK